MYLKTACERNKLFTTKIGRGRTVGAVYYPLNHVGTCKQLCCGFNVYLVLKYLNYFDFHSPLSQILDYGNQHQ